jgi:hypothetical protein
MLIHLIREKGIAIESYRLYFLKAVCIATLGYAVVGACFRACANILPEGSVNIIAASTKKIPLKFIVD